MRRSNRNHRATKKAAKRSVKRSAGHYRGTLLIRHRRVHVAPPSSASEIMNSLSISAADVRAALEAIDA